MYTFQNLLKKILFSSVYSPFPLYSEQCCVYLDVKLPNFFFFFFSFCFFQDARLSTLVKSAVLNDKNYQGFGFRFYLEDHLRHCEGSQHQANLIQH